MRWCRHDLGTPYRYWQRSCQHHSRVALWLLQLATGLIVSKTVIRTVAVAAWIALVLVCRSVLDPGDPRAWSHRSRSTAAVSATEEAGYTADEVRGPRRDLYGNVIESAVGDYRIDMRGDVYEHHDPDTVITELAPPGV